MKPARLPIASVLIADPRAMQEECLEKLRRGNIKVLLGPEAGGNASSKQQLIQQMKQVDAAIFSSTPTICGEIIQACTADPIQRLKLIARAGTGYDCVDVGAATRHGVAVINAPQGNAISTAEATCCLLLALAKNTAPAAQSLREHQWAKRLQFRGEELHGKRLAVLGLGRIGLLVASRMHAFGMGVVGYDPFVDEHLLRREYPFIRLERGLEAVWPLADYISVHVPLMEKTRGLINGETLSKCKQGVRIVNVARGGIVNEEALLDGLESGRVAGAALDVFDQEPPFTSTHSTQLIDHPNVLSTPHLGAMTWDAERKVNHEVVDSILRLNGGKSLHDIGAVSDESDPITEHSIQL